MGRNLGPLNIKDSYEGLVQISGSQLTDGSGSLISSLDVTASDATSATSASYAISASEATSAVSASHSLVADTATTATTANTASYVAGANVDGTVASATSASYAVTASFAENVTTPTLDSVTTAGNTTTNDISVGAITASGNIVFDGNTDEYLIYLDNTFNAGIYSSGIALSSSTTDCAISMNGKNVLTYDRAADQFDLGANADVNLNSNRTFIFTEAGSKISGSQAIIGQITGSTQQTTGQLRLGANAPVDANKAVQIEVTDYGSVYFEAERNGVDQFRLISTDVLNSFRLEQSGSQELKVDFQGPGTIEAGGDLTIDTLGFDTIVSSSVEIQSGKSLNVLSELTASGINYPTTDGTTGQAVVTDGSGNLSFASRDAGLIDGSGTNSIRSANYTTTDAKAEAAGGIAIGDAAAVTGSTSENSIVIGKNANSKLNAPRNVIIGYQAQAQEDNRNDMVIIGANAAGYQEGVAIGADSFTIYQAVSIGKSAQANDNYAVSIGGLANVQANGGVGIGHSVSIGAGYTNAIAIGKDTSVSAAGAINIGDKWTYDGTDTTSIDGSVFIDAATETYAMSGSLGSGESWRVDYHTNGARFLSARTNSVLHLGTPSITDGITIGRNNSVGFFGDALETGTPISFTTTRAEFDVDVEVTGSVKSIGGIAMGIETFPTSDTTNGNVVIGGSGNGSSNNGPRITAGTANVCIGGYNTTVSGGTWNNIFGGSGNEIGAGDANTIVGGYYSSITGNGSWRSILGAKNSSITATGAQPRVLVGGDNNSITGGEDTAVIAGTGNSVSHDRSVVIGGSSIASSKADEVSVPNLSVKDVLNLAAQDPLPTGAVGDLAVSASALYFHNGTSWSVIS